MTHLSIEPNPQPPFPRSDEEIIFESSLESFPASDPPAWVYGKDIPPKDVSASATERSQCGKSSGSAQLDTARAPMTKQTPPGSTFTD